MAWNLGMSWKPHTWPTPPRPVLQVLALRGSLKARLPVLTPPPALRLQLFLVPMPSLLAMACTFTYLFLIPPPACTYLRC